MQTIINTKLFLLDMDGTFYLDDELLPGANEFLTLCNRKNISYTFLTNNSSKSKDDYLKKLNRLGVNISQNQMFTSGDATLQYLKENNFSKEILLIGTQSLQAQFEQSGYNTNSNNPKAVVLGFDTTINYEKLTKLCNAVRKGLPYIATHPDYNCPVKGGFIPDIGAVIAFVKASTNRMPDFIVGKPNGYIAKAAAQFFNVDVSDVCMVGDRLYTDIALGECGCMTALVMCGETKASDLEKSDLKPTVICENLLGLCEQLNLK